MPKRKGDVAPIRQTGRHLSSTLRREIAATISNYSPRRRCTPDAARPPFQRSPPQVDARFQRYFHRRWPRDARAAPMAYMKETRATMYVAITSANYYLKIIECAHALIFAADCQARCRCCAAAMPCTHGDKRWPSIPPPEISASREIESLMRPLPWQAGRR